eukprot:CAMPEP_0114270390 /NCGR_PEP_ID=MMETSP0058-20121206/27213_1 /TAXON_ID=36894 /ORGANISM="Pyramimonas parkeae, CCMP726" /LENGTH=396 /DNA_ID=CAMNT_0001389125 /DNA_START=269 /DNA_END=1460 /DNA_ORIENTATION=-
MTAVLLFPAIFCGWAWSRIKALEKNVDQTLVKLHNTKRHISELEQSRSLAPQNALSIQVESNASHDARDSARLVPNTITSILSLPAHSLAPSNIAATAASFMAECCSKLKMRSCCSGNAAGFPSAMISRISQGGKEQRLTMASTDRLRNVVTCLAKVVAEGVPGDFMETGTYKGGLCILAATVLASRGLLHPEGRQVWAVDSFQGFTFADEDRRVKRLAVERNMNNAGGLEAVKRRFHEHGVLVPGVHFVPGWFNESLPKLRRRQHPVLSVLRLDGDTYLATMYSLCSLYDTLSVGGFLIVDDFGTWPMCTRAVLEFREAFNITSQLLCITIAGATWITRSVHNLIGMFGCARKFLECPAAHWDRRTGGRSRKQVVLEASYVSSISDTWVDRKVER